MVTINPEQELMIRDFRLVRVDDGRELMKRQMRTCDADQFNRQWQDRGIPARWEPAELLAVG